MTYEEEAFANAPKCVKEALERLRKQNNEYSDIIAKQSEILAILKESAKFVDTYGGVHEKPVPYCDVTIVVYDENPNIETIKQWMEENG